MDSKQWTLHEGDCIPHMQREMEPKSVDFSVFSPPFPSVYAYTDEQCDIGNSEDMLGECKIHFSYFYKALLRIMKPGRVVMVHVAQVPRMKRSGGRGLFDFRGFNIRIAERAGFTYEYDWCCSVNPQEQALRTKSHNLQFAGLERDRANSRGALPDYLIKLVAPGENAVPIRDWDVELDEDGDTVGERKAIHEPQVSRNEWIQWAESCWSWREIKRSKTLNTTEAKAEEDTKHVCPLQLDIIHRLVKLYSNPGELVFSPFTGVGSEGFEALKLGRRFYGCEIKDTYIETAKKNLAKAVRMSAKKEESLFA